MYFTKRYYRILESIIKKTLNFKNHSNNVALEKTIQSAIYNSTKKEKILFLNKNNKKYIVHTNDHISKLLFINAEFDFKILKKALKYLGKKHKRHTLINIGAHIGSTCIEAIKMNYFKNSIAFEPAIRNFRLLKANILINSLENRIKVFHLAISNEKKVLRLSINKLANSGDNRILKKKDKIKYEKVKSEKLDNFTSTLNRNNTLVFMDVQGHEPYVFLGAKKTIKKKIPIVFEFSPYLSDKNWLKYFKELFKNYNYLYDLQNDTKLKFTSENLLKLHKKLKLKNEGYTDLLIL
jgi:FkbM family methyltransferase